VNMAFGQTIRFRTGSWALPRYGECGLRPNNPHTTEANDRENFALPVVRLTRAQPVVRPSLCAGSAGLGGNARNAQATSGRELPPRFADIAFMHRYRLALIECKSGTQETIPVRMSSISWSRRAPIRACASPRIWLHLANVWDKQEIIRPAVRNRAGRSTTCRILIACDPTRLAAAGNLPPLLLKTVLFQSLGEMKEPP